MTLHLFFSWQVETDTQKQHNKTFIWDCINAAINKIQNKGELKGVFIKAEEGVRDEPGTPDVIGVCEDRIDKCHIFVSDMTIAESYSLLERVAAFLSKKKHRVGPNRNVNNEYGRARGKKESGQIITVMNTINGKLEEDNEFFPIDIRKYRFPITFTLKRDEAYCDKAEYERVKSKLIEDLSIAIAASAKVALSHIKDEMLPFINWDNHKKIGDFRGGYADTADLLELKKQIRENTSNIRILGMSGLGKTRLVLESFKQNRALYWYFDCQSEKYGLMKERLPKIFKEYGNYVLVFDNCDKAMSIEIVKLKRSCQASNPLVTIYNGIEEASDSLYTPLSMQTRYDAVVEEIIKRYTALYKEEDKNRIMDFAGGIPMLAQLLMDGLLANRALGDVTDEALMSKILLTEPDSEDRRLMQSFSLFDFIGYRGDLHSELEYVVTHKDITNIDKDRDVLCNDADELIERNLKRRIIEQRGRKIGIRPAPIAFYLVGEWLSNCSEDRMIRVVKALQEAKCADALTSAFADQFRNMGFNAKARQMLNQLMGPNSPFSSAEVINTRLGSRLFRSFAEVNPVAVANTLWKVLGSIEIERLRSMEDGRRNLVWTLEKLCFEPKSFVPAAKTMMRLAQAENEQLGNNATQEFIRLFPVILPATAVDLATRLLFLKEEFTVEENKSILLQAIKAALHTRDFIYMGGAEKQGLKTLTNYQPKTTQEVFEYLEGCVDLIMEEARRDSKHFGTCVEVIEADFNSLCIFGAAKIILPCFDMIAKIKGYDWDGMLNDLHLLKVQTVNPLSKSLTEEIDKRIKLLSKSDYVSRFHYVSLSHRWNIGRRFEEGLKDDAKQYVSLAEELVREKLYTVELLRKLFSLDNTIVEPFGERIAEVIPEADIRVFLENVLDAQITGNNLGYTIILQFLKSIDENFFGIAVSMLLDRKEYRILFAGVAVRGYSTKHEYVEQLFESMERGVIPVVFFQHYWSNLRIDSMTDDDLADTYSRIIKIPGSTDLVIWMSESMTYRIKLKDYPKTAGVLEDLLGSLNSTDYREMKSESFWPPVFTLLEEEYRAELAKHINNRILEFIVSDDALYIGNYNIERSYSILLEKYFDVVWPDLSDALSGKDEWLSYRLQQLLGDRISNTLMAQGLLFRQDHTAELIGWCERDPQNNPPILMSMAPVEGTSESFSPIVLELINRYGDNQRVLDSLASNMGTFSYTGSVIPLYESHLNMLRGLTSHPIERVRMWASRMIAGYEIRIDHEIEYEEEQDFHIRESSS